MAKSNRDLTIALIAKADQFDLAGPAGDLEKLGDSAKDAGKELEGLDKSAKSLEKVGDAAKDAGREVESGMEKAEKSVESVASPETRRDLDNFFERVGKAGKQAGREIDDGMDRAKRGMDDMKSEAGQSGKEAAASFSGGFDSVTDFMQETAANALAGFGAIGGALGIAAAAGLGFLANKAAEAAENIKNARDSLRELYSSGDATGKDKIEEFFEFLSDVGVDLPGLNRVLQEAGITMEEFIQAGAEGGPVFDEVQRKLRELGGSGLGLAGILGNDMASGAQAAFDALGQYRTGATGATEDTRIMGDVLDNAKVRQEEFNAELQSLADAKHEEAIGSIQTALEGVADASGAVAEAVAEEGQVQIEALTESLNEATKTAKAHRKNVQEALREGGEEFAAWVAEQGPEVSKAYADGSEKERAALRKAFENNVGAAMGEGIVGGLDGSKQTVTDAAGNVYTVAKNRLTGETILIPVTVDSPSAYDVASIRQRIIANFGTIRVPVVPDVSGIPRSERRQFLP